MAKGWVRVGVGSFFTSRLDEAIGWARKYSIFQYPFVTACCGMEFMAMSSPRYDFSRFGAEAPRFSPRRPMCFRERNVRSFLAAEPARPWLN